MKTYQLTVSETQAKAIEAACDLMARIMIGQSAEIVRHLPLDKAHKVYTWDMGRAIEAITKPPCNLEMNASYGVGYSEKADMLIDLVEVLRHKLAWDHARAENLLTPDGRRDHATMGGVCYDAPMQWAKRHPLARIEAVE
jgi:hypothetical protein